MKPICAGGGPTEVKQYYSGYSSSVVSERKIDQSIEASYVGGENALHTEMEIAQIHQK